MFWKKMKNWIWKGKFLHLFSYFFPKSLFISPPTKQLFSPIKQMLVQKNLFSNRGGGFFRKIYISLILEYLLCCWRQEKHRELQELQKDLTEGEEIHNRLNILFIFVTLFTRKLIYFPLKIIYFPQFSEKKA